MSIHVMVGERISDEATGGMKQGSFATLVCGNSAARLDLTVGGSVKVLDGSKESR